MTLVTVTTKPPIYNAIQWTGSNYSEIETLVDGHADMRLLPEDNTVIEFSNYNALYSVSYIPLNNWMTGYPLSYLSDPDEMNGFWGGSISDEQFNFDYQEVE